MRIRYSRSNSTIEVSRFVPFSSSTSPSYRNRMPSATEVTKGEWTKKVVPLPKGERLDIAGKGMSASERDGLIHLEECREVCDKLEGVTSPTVSSQTPRSILDATATQEKWVSFVDNDAVDESEGDINHPQILRADAWVALRTSSPPPPPSPSPRPIQSTSLRTSLAREMVQKISSRPSRPRLSFNDEETSGGGSHGTETRTSLLPPLKVANRGRRDKLASRATQDVSLLASSSDVGAKQTKSSLRISKLALPRPAVASPSSVAPHRTAKHAQPSSSEQQEDMETRFIPGLGWCIKTIDREAVLKYSLMFLDGASLEVSESRNSLIMMDRQGKRHMW